jgi:hypothetical protein
LDESGVLARPPIVVLRDQLPVAVVDFENGIRQGAVDPQSREAWPDRAHDDVGGAVIAKHDEAADHYLIAAGHFPSGSDVGESGGLAAIKIVNLHQPDSGRAPHAAKNNRVGTRIERGDQGRLVRMSGGEADPNKIHPLIGAEPVVVLGNKASALIAQLDDRVRQGTGHADRSQAGANSSYCHAFRQVALNDEPANQDFGAGPHLQSRGDIRGHVLLRKNGEGLKSNRERVRAGVRFDYTVCPASDAIDVAIHGGAKANKILRCDGSSCIARQRGLDEVIEDLTCRGQLPHDHVLHRGFIQR